MSFCFRSQFAHGGEEIGGGLRIRQRIERYGGRELGRLRPETHLQHVLLPRRHKRIQFRRGILLPVRAGGQNDGTRFAYLPFALISSLGRAAAAGTPAVAEYLR